LEPTLARNDSRIYLDHAATTPMRPEAIAAVMEGMARWANPSSPHVEGRAARAALEGARKRIAQALDSPAARASPQRWRCVAARVSRWRRSSMMRSSARPNSR
jgi:selenocysteine lyase/cysteine desulfurase